MVRLFKLAMCLCFLASPVQAWFVPPKATRFQTQLDALQVSEFRSGRPGFLERIIGQVTNRAFQPTRFVPPTSFQIQVDGVHFSEPRRNCPGFLGHVIGWVTNRIIDGFLSDERKESNFQSTVLQTVFLMGVIEIVSGNDLFLKSSP